MTFIFMATVAKDSSNFFVENFDQALRSLIFLSATATSIAEFLLLSSGSYLSSMLFNGINIREPG